MSGKSRQFAKYAEVSAKSSDDITIQCAVMSILSGEVIKPKLITKKIDDRESTMSMICRKATVWNDDECAEHNNS